MDDPIQLRFSIRNCIEFLLLLSFGFGLGSGRVRDGVIVTEGDYQALIAIKHELVDSLGVLKSWNESGDGACSGWAGIKCVKGQVIAIQLPWRGLGGRISEKIGQLQELRRLSLHDNRLVGPVPTSLGFLLNLRGVYLFNNLLSGSIPLSIANCPHLQTLDLSNNQLIGIIPPALGNSTRLYRLNLSFNAISGAIPVTLSLSPSLTFLALHHNHLDGHIPESFNKLQNLTVLNLSNNRFESEIPEKIGNITSLTVLDLSTNNLTGEIPISFSNLPNLSSFSVSYNNLSGPVPSALASKFNSSSFTGNLQLCGYTSSIPCASPSSENGPPSTPQRARNHHGRKLSTKDIVLIASGALLLVLLTLCCVLLCCLIGKRPGTKTKNGKTRAVALTGRGAKPVAVAGAEAESSAETGGKLVHFDGPFVFTADDLLCATAEIMGKSAYGTAYKATLEDNNQVAVKRLREKMTKGQKEFELEVSELGKIRHLNILALRAYYLGPKGEKLLVYDYMPNGSLASFLHARGPETSIPWPTRMSIAIGITRGLCYLHNEINTVHGNLTASNVLLDEHNDPKIADVGLSRLMTSAANTNVIATAGSMGYRAPEFSKLKNASPKTDVFSLGVIILELLTGKSPSEAKDGLDLPQWVASIVKEEWTNEVFDVELMREASGGNNNGDELLNTLKLALHCVDPSQGARPEARQVLEKLEEIKAEAAADVSKTAEVATKSE